MDDCHFSYITKLVVIIGHVFKLSKYLLSPDGRLLHQYAAQWHLKDHRQVFCRFSGCLKWQNPQWRLIMSFHFDANVNSHVSYLLALLFHSYL